MSNTPTEADIQRMVENHLNNLGAGGQAALQQVFGTNPGMTGEYEDLEEALDDIDPADSDSHIALLNKLVDNQRLIKVATLTEGGYMFLYQEPKGSTKEGWTAGGTQGDRLVDDALATAKEGGPKAKQGLCKQCFSSITQVEGQKPKAESPRPGADPTECPKTDPPGGPHAMV